MKTKVRDEKYCGVDKDKIKKAHPVLDDKVFHILIYGYIKDRYELHINKDIKKLDPPWSMNDILNEYRFTNVRRELDKQTRWLIENISTNEDLSYEDKLMNTILFRLFSKYETMEIIGAPIHFIGNRDIESEIEDKCSIMEEYSKNNPKYLWFTSAFFTNGIKANTGRAVGSQYIHPVRVLRYVYELSTKYNILEDIKGAKNQQECYLKLRNLPALGDFMSYQVFIDFTYIEEFPFSENEFTVAGVGCVKGLNYLFKDFDGLSEEEALFWLRDNIDSVATLELLKNTKYKTFNNMLNKLMIDIPKEDRYMNIMSLENCMCELGKYMDIVLCSGRSRPRYKNNRL